MVNLHLVVKFQQAITREPYKILKKLFFLWLSFSKSNKIYENKEILRHRITNFHFFLKFHMG